MAESNPDKKARWATVEDLRDHMERVIGEIKFISILTSFTDTLR